MISETLSLKLAAPLARPPKARVSLVVVLALTACFFASSIGCVTPLSRPEKTPVSAPTGTMTPETTPTATVEPIPTPTPAPTPRETPAFSPTPAPTAGAVPTSSAVGFTPTPPVSGPADRFLLQVFAPDDGATVPGGAVAVYGQTVPGASVEVSGVEAEVDRQGGFRAEVPLSPGENTISVVATSDGRATEQVSRRVLSLALPFLLLITEPENESVVSLSSLPLTGRTGPNAIVSINGRSVPVNMFGYFSSTALLDEGPNVIDVVATNSDGQTLSTVLAVIYRPSSE